MESYRQVFYETIMARTIPWAILMVISIIGLFVPIEHSSFKITVYVVLVISIVLTMRDQLLQSAGELWNDNRLDAATKLRAVDSAHKLAGVLAPSAFPEVPIWRGRRKGSLAKRRRRTKRRSNGCRSCWRS